ncbi:MAG: hypothetical protein CMB97_13595 [Flavobacteriaceae bacterium]|nr:hypothetical protein [Flavobacteriaceae bacterium]|tara:strand:+ start:831 stop:1667 length:837 start_codon:yes stop_codon:yes gene_type:complete
MQFVYIDESGTGDEPIGVMVGILADSYRMRPTKEDWLNLLIKLSSIVGREIDEIHTRDFYSGNSPWRGLSGKQRSDIISAIIDWLHERRHSIVYTAVHKETFYKLKEENEKLQEIGTLWRFMALHLALSLQKFNQGSARGKKRKINAKGSTLLIFDHEHREQQRFTDLVLSPPDWTDTYYDKKPKQEKMSQIIDVPHFVDSKQVGLIQLADFLCFFLRKHIELEEGFVDPSYADELDKVKDWTEQIIARSIPKSNILLSRGRCDCAELFYECAPESIK